MTELAVTIMVAARRLTFWKLSDNDKHKNSSLTWKNAENVLFLKPRLESDGQVCIVLRLTRVEANVDSKASKGQGFLRDFLKRQGAGGFRSKS